MIRVAIADSRRGQANPWALALVSAILWMSLGVSSVSAAEDFLSTALKLTDDFRAELEKLAAWCDQRRNASE